MLQALKDFLADLLWPLADLMGVLLPEFVRVPSLNFILPHVMYWCALMGLPFLAMTMVWWEKNRGSATAVPRWVAVVLHLGLAAAMGPLWGSVIVHGVVDIQNPLTVPLSRTFAPEVWLLGFVVGAVIAQAVLWLMRRGLTRRRADEGRERRVTPPLAYFLWLGGGFLGLHRLYLRAGRLTIVYMIFFGLLLLGNDQADVAREAQSEARDARISAEFDAEHFRGLVEQGRDMEDRLREAEERLAEATSTLEATSMVRRDWDAFAGFFGWLIALMLLVDAVLIPRLVRRCNAMEIDQPPPGEVQVLERERPKTERETIATPATRAIDTVNGWVGEFIAYWAVIAVAVYYYEVLARYVFNSPTNWAHEGMFLMFGMQYLLSGGYALRENAHVRVDVVYERFSENARAVIDLFTSIFFFVFTMVLFVTGTLFALDAVAVWEVSFNEWAIQYWPVKLTLGVGAILILLQGVAGVVRDVIFLQRKGGPRTRAALRWIGLIGGPAAALALLWVGLPYIVPYGWVEGVSPLLAGSAPEPLTTLLFGEGGPARAWFWALFWLVATVVFIWLAARAVRRLPGARGA